MSSDHETLLSAKMKYLGSCGIDGDKILRLALQEEELQAFEKGRDKEGKSTFLPIAPTVWDDSYTFSRGSIAREYPWKRDEAWLRRDDVERHLASLIRAGVASPPFAMPPPGSFSVVEPLRAAATETPPTAQPRQPKRTGGRPRKDAAVEEAFNLAYPQGFGGEINQTVINHVKKQFDSPLYRGKGRAEDDKIRDFLKTIVEGKNGKPENPDS